MLRDTTLNWCHTYMSKFLDYTFSKFTQTFCKHHWKIQKWRSNIHGVEKHEVVGDWEGGGLLWAYSKTCSWFTSTNHILLLNYGI